MTRGSRESQWLVLRRCLAIVRQLQRGPADKETLMAAVRISEFPEDPYNEAEAAEDTRVAKKFEKGLWRIRQTGRIRPLHSSGSELSLSH